MSTTPNAELYTELRDRQRAIEARIVEYRAKIADSERELKECLKMLQQLPPRGYPVLTLPNEIMSEIFVYSSVPSILGRASTPNPRYAPMLLLHVCSAWRAIALATPALWTDLWLNFHWRDLSARFFEAENLDKFFADYLVRLGACPLSLTIQGSVQSVDEGRRIIAAVFDLLSPRLEVLDLMTDMNYYRDHRPLFPLLRELTVGFPLHEYDDLIGLPGRPIQTFSAAAQLRKLYLTMKATPSHFAIPWETLTAFDGSEVSSRECVQVLRSAPSLVECSIHAEMNEHVDLAPLSHQNLKSFKLRSGGEALFPSVTFPALEDMNIFAEDMSDEHLLQFISRSSSTLLRFSAENVSMQSLKDMTLLTHLQLLAPKGRYLITFLNMLDRTMTPGFLPQLQTLEFEDCRPFVHPALVEVLSSRAVSQDGAAKLRSYRQIWSIFPFEELQVRYEGSVALALKKLVEGGMEIYIGPPKWYDIRASNMHVALTLLQVANTCVGGSKLSPI
ncbi:F-box domain-containing protein [Mycena sanguinolenta]|uniref:F-box domain-containing protein n=1 Tax=Mycena sanguinolenta TaxID=230812 RepID=A0A8H6X6T2_9AGAR|nr:F-box domain-containing protein [Mycena sanguinolenta]